MTFRKPLRSVNVFANEAFNRHPVTMVLRQVKPNSAIFTQGNFCGGACSNTISAVGLKELSMKLQFGQPFLLRWCPSPALQRLQVLAWLESNSFSWRDVHFRTRTRIPADARLSRFHREHAKAAQLDAIVGFEGILHAIEDCIDRLFRFCFAHSRPLDDLIHEIEFDHWNLRFRLKPTTTICCTYF